ncbi:uncharacterized protein LOC131675239 [Phymastichus coffea]|uniref:uncharacterized protein LOC131675239 n=1 Tax=Phymastichus coffea TaxID=108790 RepID=UPI00273B5733|nr:uncharacterized protein LOC131675239 [Phymastichus coffea]
MVVTDSPFFKTAMDIVGLMPTVKLNNRYCLTFQCMFTRFAIGIPIPDQTAITIADAFIKRVVCLFGAPNGLLTDCGQNFLSNLMKRVAKRFRIKQFRTSAFHPESNGVKERQQSSLNEYLKVFTNKFEDWDEFVEMAMFN